MNKNSNRLGRIDEELKKEISQIITYELKNPNITGMISVTKAKITPDLKYAQVYVSILNSKNVKETLAGLKKSSGFIRTIIAKRINLRITPEIIFVLDDSMEYGERIDKILKEILPEEKRIK
jgi:ribosome-binding factor A